MSIIYPSHPRPVLVELSVAIEAPSGLVNRMFYGAKGSGKQ